MDLIVDSFQPDWSIYTSLITKKRMLAKVENNAPAQEPLPVPQPQVKPPIIMVSSAVQTEPVRFADDESLSNSPKLCCKPHRKYNKGRGSGHYSDDDVRNNQLSMKQSIPKGTMRPFYMPYVQAIKIDALWKPLIRKFRQFIKKRVLQEVNFKMLRISMTDNEALQ